MTGGVGGQDGSLGRRSVSGAKGGQDGILGRSSVTGAGGGQEGILGRGSVSVSVVLREGRKVFWYVVLCAVMG